MNVPLRLAVSVAAVYLSWEAMMAVHESGHVLAAVVGGGHVRRVIVPAIGFSRTDVDPSPSPRLEVWGGPVWGSAFPLIIWIAVGKHIRGVLHNALGFFAGLCLIVNGAYLGIGWACQGGDAVDLVNLSTPVWALILFGLPVTVSGFYVWHKLGSLTDLFRAGK